MIFRQIAGAMPAAVQTGFDSQLGRDANFLGAVDQYIMEIIYHGNTTSNRMRK